MLREIILQSASPLIADFVVSAVMGLVTMGIGWVIWWWQRITGYQVSEQTRVRFTEAVERGLQAGVNIILIRRGLTSTKMFTANDWAAALDEGASYVEKFNPGDVKKFRLSHAAIKDRLTPLLPLDRSNLG